MQSSARQERARLERDEIRNKTRHFTVPQDDVHAAGIWTATGGQLRADSLGDAGSRLVGSDSWILGNKAAQ